jgi:hypothetical protein
MSTKTGGKGSIAEEALRAYFLESGYFAVRGVKAQYNDLDVTDIDVWLYLRASALHRIRANVDTKNRGSPKAMERILWARGLQAILGLDHAIVATPDARPVVEEFGAMHGVQVLGGAFLSQLTQRPKTALDTRVTEEDFVALITADGIDKLQGSWMESAVGLATRPTAQADAQRPVADREHEQQRHARQQETGRSKRPSRWEARLLRLQRLAGRRSVLL